MCFAPESQLMLDRTRSRLPTIHVRNGHRAIGSQSDLSSTDRTPQKLNPVDFETSRSPALFEQALDVPVRKPVSATFAASSAHFKLGAR